MSEHLDDAALMRLIAQSDEPALRKLYDRYKALIYGLALQVSGDASAAEEITLDVFLQVWRHAPEYRASSAAVRTWLTVIARNRAIDHLRRAKTHLHTRHPQWAEAEPDGLPAQVDLEADLLLRDERRKMIRAVADLPQEQKLALSLAYFKGYSHGEIAMRLGWPVGTVKTRIRSAMQQLKRVLARKADDRDPVAH